MVKSLLNVLANALTEQVGGQHGLLSRREGRLATGIAALAIMIIACMPGPVGTPSLFGWDKLDHISAFVALTLLARAGWPSAPRWRTFAGLLGYGLVIELIQSLPVIGRTGSVTDMVANAIGIALGLAVALWLGRLARTLSWLPNRMR